MARTLSIQARDKVLATAQQVLVEEGLEGLTVDGIAHRSGVAKTTIYRHFATVHDLMVEALDCMIDPVATPNTGSLRDDLLELFVKNLAAADDPKLRMVILDLLAASARDPELDRVARSLKDQRRAPIRTIVELARARGEVRADIDLDDAIDLIEGPVFNRIVIRGDPLSEADFARLVDLALTALR